jgi:hypothetical protein
MPSIKNTLLAIEDMIGGSLYQITFISRLLRSLKERRKARKTINPPIANIIKSIEIKMSYVLAQILSYTKHTYLIRKEACKRIVS